MFSKSEKARLKIECSIVNTIIFHSLIRIRFYYIGLNDTLANITSLGGIVFLNFQISQCEGGVLKGAGAYR